MSRFWSDVVKGLTPYVPGEQPRLANLVKLNTNENPYGPSPHALQAIRDATGESLKLYPDPNAGQLKFAIAQYQNLDDATKLSRPSYQALNGGVEISVAGQQLKSSHAVRRIVRYEQIIIDNNYKRFKKRFSIFIFALLTTSSLAQP